MTVKTTSLAFSTKNQSVWGSDVKTSFRLSSEDLLVYKSGEKTKSISFGGSFIGGKADAYISLKAGLEAYAEIGISGSFSADYAIDVTVSHEAAIDTSLSATNNVNFTLSQGVVRNASISSIGFEGGAKAGLDIVLGVDAGLRNVEAHAFGLSKKFAQVSLVNFDEHFPIIKFEPTTEFSAELYSGVELTVRLPTGANTSGRSTSSIVKGSGFSTTQFVELNVDVDTVLLDLAEKIPEVGVIIKKVGEVVFFDESYDLSDFTGGQLPSGKVVLSGTVFDIDINAGAVATEDVALNIGGADVNPDVRVILRSDGGTPTDFSDDRIVQTTLGGSVAIQAITDAKIAQLGGSATATVTGYYDLSNVRFDHAVGFGLQGKFTIRGLAAELGGDWVPESFGLKFGPLVDLTFPQGGLKVKLGDIYKNNFNLKTGTYNAAANGSNPTTWGYSAGAFNQVTDTYKVFVTNVSPPNWDAEASDAVQQAYAYRMALQANTAALIANTSGLLTGTTITNPLNAGLTTNSATSQSFVWDGRRSSQIQTNTGGGTNHVLAAPSPSSVTQTSPFGLKANLIAASAQGFNGTKLVANDVAVNSSYADKLALLDALPAAVGNHYFQYSYGANILKSTIGIDVLGGELGDMLVRFGNQTKFFDGGASAGDGNDIFMANFLATDPNTAINFSTLNGQGVTGFSIAGVTIKDVEGFILRTGNADDLVTGGETQDWFETSGGKDIIRFGEDSLTDVAGGGSGDDVVIVEYNGTNSGSAVDAVYGGLGTDLAVFQSLDTAGSDATGLQLKVNRNGTTTAFLNANSSVTDLLAAVKLHDAGRYGGADTVINRDVLVSAKAAIRAGSGIASGISQFSYQSDFGAATFASDVEKVSVIGSSFSNDVVLFANGLTYDGGDGTIDFLGPRKRVDTLIGDFGSYAVQNGITSGLALIAEDRFGNVDPDFKLNFGNASIKGFERYVAIGTASSDFFLGGQYNDYFDGGAGDDVIDGGEFDYGELYANGITLAESDTLLGGAGNDVFLWSNDGADVIDGGADTDTLVVQGEAINASGVEYGFYNNAGTRIVFTAQSSQDDIVTALGMNHDILVGSTLFGRTIRIGDPSISDPNLFLTYVNVEEINVSGTADRSDLVIYQNGATYFGGEDGTDTTVDTFAADWSQQIVGVNFSIGEIEDSQDVIQNNGILIGQFERAVILGGTASDRFAGGAFDDYFDGGAGADILFGGGGNDRLFGGAGDDVVFWDGNGEDIARGGADEDHLVVGGNGSGLTWFFQNSSGTGLTNSIIGAGSSRADIDSALANLPQAAEFQIFTNSTRVIFSGFEHIDIAGTDAADDLVIYQRGLVNIGGDRVGDADLFAADLSSETADLTLVADDRNDAGQVPGGGVAAFTTDGGFSGDASSLYDIGNGSYIGGFERFNIRLGSGNDTAVGGTLSDTIIGGDGDDTLDTGTGGTAGERDILVGGNGNDVLVYRGGFADIDGSNAGSDFDTLSFDAAVTQLSFAVLDAGGVQIGSTYVAGSGAGTTTTRADLTALFAANPTFAAGVRYDFIAGSLILRNIEQFQIAGSATADFLVATLRQGVLIGNGGDDTLVSNLGTDVLMGGTGFDTYAFDPLAGQGSGVDVIVGETVGGARLYFNATNRSQVTFGVTNGDDLTIGSVGSTINVLDYFAGGGNGLNFVFDFADQVGTIDLSGLAGIVPGVVPIAGLTVVGTSANDDLSAAFSANADRYTGGAGDDYFEGSAGPDVFDGSSGRDLVSFYKNGNGGGVSVDLIQSRGFSGIAAGDVFINIEDLAGTSLGDALRGDEIDNTIFGNGGGDTIEGRGGDDHLIGGTGNDTISGNDGKDIISGDEDNDTLFGNAGDDTINGGSGNDTVDGGAGNDTLFGKQGNDTVAGGNDDDIYVYGGDDDALTAIVGGTNNENGTDSFDGGTGIDVVDLSRSEFAVKIVLGASTGSVTSEYDEVFNDAGAPAFTLVGLVNVEQAVGSSFADILVSAAPGVAFDGGAGDDTFFGSTGSQLLVGGSGYDVARYDAEGGVFRIIVDLTGPVGTVTDTFGTIDSVEGIEEFRGTAGDDNFFGDATNNVFSDGDGVDVFQGFGGNDRVIAGATGTAAYDDSYDGGDGFDTIDYSAATSGVGIVLGGMPGNGGASAFDRTAFNIGNDTVLSFEGAVGTAFSDQIFGGDGVNILEGGAGNDEVGGGGGDDVIIAGAGNDTYFGGSSFIDSDFVSKDTLDYSKITGGVVLDRVAGTAVKLGGGTDQFGSFEKFIASAGSDTFTGNLLDDEFFYVGPAGSGGFDHWDGAAGIDIANFSFFGAGIHIDLAASVEVSTRDAANLDPLAGPLRNIADLSNFEEIVVTEFSDEYLGTDGADRLEGHGGNDFLTGRAGDDELRGDAGSDTVDYSKETGAAGVTVDLTGALTLTFVGGIDTFGNQDTFNSIENVIGTDRADVIIGGLGPHILDGRGGGDLISVAAGENIILGGAGNDLLTGGLDADTIDGGADNDTIDGGDGDDVIEGGSGTDILIGGLGIDTLSYLNALSVVVASLLITGAQNTGGAGTDTVTGFENILGSDFGDTLIGDNGANVLSGGGGNDLLKGGLGADTLDGGDSVDTADYRDRTQAIKVTLNGATDAVVTVGGVVEDKIRNIEQIFGGTAGDLLTGDDLDNTFFGFNGSDVLTGGLGNDWLDGGAGVDTLVGGAGSDVYTVDNAGDIVTELVNEGIDTVRTGLSYTLGANVENIEILFNGQSFGTGNALANTITGNTSNNTLRGLAGTDTLIGGGGNDTLDGGTEADVMSGGTGNDLYLVDNAGDVATELLNEGIDTVQTGISFTLGANVENLTLLYNGKSWGLGNALDNIITGNLGDNVLRGYGGNDTLNGYLGADAMAGGTGNDTYVLDNAGDVVTELFNEGTDTVQTGLSYTLGTNVENLTLLYNGKCWGSGNELGNTIVGNISDNVLRGLAGNDILTGGTGADAFVFNTPLNASTNVDTITDFSVSQGDVFWLDDAVFKALAPGALQPADFVTGASAINTAQNVIYDSGTGSLFYDADGLGGVAQVKFASVTPGVNLTTSQFVVV